MKNFKRMIAAATAFVTVCALGACGCSKNGAIKEVVTESTVSGGDVMNEIWSADLDASAALIDGYHATSVQEVLDIWRQAHMQKNDMGLVNGNGALIYGICSPDLRPRCLEIIKANGYGGWNFYYNAQLQASDQALVPQEMTFSQPEKIEESDMIRYIVEVNEITSGGSVATYQLYVDFIDGGYYLSGKSSMNTENAVNDAEDGFGIGERE